MFVRFFFLFSACLLLGAAPTLAQPGSVSGMQASKAPLGAAKPKSVQVRISPDEALGVAEGLFAKGEVAQAEAILKSFSKANPDNVDVDRLAFLTGMIVAKKGQYKAAIEIYRSILVRKPELIRVRLELALALFELRDDGPAAYHFRFALSDALPEDVRKIVRGYLKAIEARKVLRLRFTVGLVPNSNINTGPNDTTVRLFGLVPFDLSAEARQTSGVGLSSSLSLSALPALNAKWRLEANVAARVTDYENKAFDDVFVSLEAGPRYEGARLKASLLATASERYFAGERLTSTVGTRLVLTTPLAQRTRFSVRASYAHADDHRSSDRDGPIYGSGASISHALDQRSFGGGSIQITRQETKARSLRNTQYAVSLFYSRELPLGITARLSPQFVLRSFGVPAAINNGITRLDRLYGVTIDLTKRNLSLYGFAPVLSYTFLHNTSSVDLFEYDQHRVNIGLTRLF